MNTKQDPQRVLRWVICILLVLLLVVGGILTLRLLSLRRAADDGDTVIIPDNLIGKSQAPRPRSGIVLLTETVGSAVQEEAASVSLYKGQPSDNEPFSVTNMLPGDTVTQYFCLQVSHSAAVSIYFSAEVVEQTKQLADVLQIRITRLETGAVIYEGSLSEMVLEDHAELLHTSPTGLTQVYYQVDVTLPGRVGNEHQNAMLEADLIWYVKDEESLDPLPGTGDIIWLTVAAAAISLSIVILLVYLRRREKEAEDAKRA